MKKIILFLLFPFLLFGYCDEELEELWSKIADINHPVLEDLRLIENYLMMGKRPYLDGFRKSMNAKDNAYKASCQDRFSRIMALKLAGPNGEMPIFEKHSFRITEATKNRCILLFGSYNDTYLKKTRRALADLKKCGYSGHVLVRIGGYPNMPFGGLKLCFIPYAFKAAFLREAQLLGFKEALWIDTALHPLTHLEMIFREIKEKGHFFTYVGSLEDNAPSHLLDAAHTLGIGKENYRQIPHLSSSMIGLNLQNPRSAEFLENWMEETEKVYSNITWFPEELNLSVIAWRLGCQPYAWFGEICCMEQELSIFPPRKDLQFFLDSSR